VTPAWLVAWWAILGCCAVFLWDVTDSPAHPAIRPLAVLVALLGTLTTAIALTRTPLLGAGPVLEMALLAGYVFASLTWIAFVLAYTGYGPPVTWRLAAGLLALGGCTALSSTVTWLHEVGRVDVGAVGTASYVVTFLLQVGVFALGVLGVVVLARATVEFADLPADRGGALAAGGVGIVALPFTVLAGSALPTATAMAIPFVVIGTVVVGLATLQRRRDLFAAAPVGGHLARDAVLEHLGDPVVVTDRRHRLLDANRAAATAFDLDRTGLRRQRLPAVAGVDDDVDLADPVEIRTAAGRREFDVGRSEIQGGDGDRIAIAYRFRDVTDRRTREQQLQVLNRVTRHNLRNDLDAIRAFAEPIRDGEVAPATADEQFDRIGDVARDLVDLSDSIERSGRLLADPEPARDRCDVVALLRTAIGDAVPGSEAAMPGGAGDPERTTADVALASAVDSLPLVTDPALLRLIVDELLENAIEHSDREVPSITVAVEANVDGATIEVRDDGPGVPEYEQGVLLAGEETPATHGSGVGLWLVYWAVTQLGGSLAFEPNDPRGTVVRAELPDLDGTGARPGVSG
jgi:signal transduction histidine kinase